MQFVNAFRLIKFLVLIGLFVACPQVFGQTRCLTEEEAKTAVNLINSPRKITENKTLRLELLNMVEARRKFDQKIIDNPADSGKLIPNAYEMGEKNLLRLCEIVKQHGWTSKELVGADGSAAAVVILKSNHAYAFQKEIFPIVVAAAKRELIGNQEVAWLIDSIRTAAGVPQIFGTQTKIRNDAFHLLPLQNESKVDEWRKIYNLPPLADYIKFLQSRYQMVVFKTPTTINPQPAKKEPEATGTTKLTVNPLIDLEENEVIKVASNLVSLNVRVSSEDATTKDILSLKKDDFEVYEDDKKQEISFFSAADAPFDLILLLDLSGSTADKQELIRKSTRRFIEASRPTDRIAIVTFTDEAKIISDLTQNRETLLKSVKNIDDMGGSAVWGSLEFVLERVTGKQSGNRRTAILMMTDGVDSSLLSFNQFPASYPTFTDVLETVRNNDASIFPIYLDTSAQAREYEKKAYQTAQQTLKMMAEESGGQMYYAKKVNDLNGIYEKVINDLGKVYSIGYEPLNDVPPGTFHRLTVKLPNHPQLNVRTKQSYFTQ